MEQAMQAVNQHTAAAPRSAQGPAPDETSSQRLGHFGSAVELFSIAQVNLLLKVLTVGIYHFWGKTRVRRYVWSRTSFAGERFEYIGRGADLARGFAIAMAVLIPFFVLWSVLKEVMDNVGLIVLISLTGYTALIFLTGLARFSSRRYLLSRTRWRSIRFGLSGSALAHGRRMLLYSLMLILTSGLYLPFMRNNLTAHILRNIWYGDRQVTYTGTGRGMFRRFFLFLALCLAVIIGLGVFYIILFAVVGFGGDSENDVVNWILVGLPAIAPWAALVGLMVLWLWYRAGEFRYYTANIALAGVRFRADFGTTRYILLSFSNTVLMTLTLGLAYPWVVVRTARFAATHLKLVGELDFASISQGAHAVPRSGEGLAEALDLGGI